MDGAEGSGDKAVGTDVWDDWGEPGSTEPRREREGDVEDDAGNSFMISLNMRSSRLRARSSRLSSLLGARLEPV